MDNTNFKERYGPVALVTGASSGIGESFAQQLAARGLDLVLVARRVDRLEALAAALEGQHGIKVTVLPVDLADAAAPQLILNETASLDIGLLVSNAGFGIRGDLAGNDARALAEMLMVNCHVPMLLANGFIPRLRQRGRGGLILTGSVEGLIGCPNSTAYSATKAFIKNLGEGLWAELTPDGIDVLTLCPGATRTEALERANVGDATLANAIPADDVARLALENIKEGPSYFPSAYYRASFDHLLSLPRREALAMMAKATKS